MSNVSAQLLPPDDRPALPASASQEMVISRQAQEVQAAMVIAKRFPRNVIEAETRVLNACTRRKLAEQAIYSYPRGGTSVEGPSIRLAETLAQCWGNIDFGILELDQRDGESTVMAYAWDLETNARQTKVFQVRHERRVGKGKQFTIDRLSDPRDVYEMVANQGARRLRACILGVIPGDIVDSAVEKCNETLKKADGRSTKERMAAMVDAFAAYGIIEQDIVGRLGHNLSAITEVELAQLRKVYNSIKDGMSKPADHFDVTSRSRMSGSSLPPLDQPEPPAPQESHDDELADKVVAAYKAAGILPREVEGYLRSQGKLEAKQTLADLPAAELTALMDDIDATAAAILGN